MTVQLSESSIDFDSIEVQRSVFIIALAITILRSSSNSHRDRLLKVDQEKIFTPQAILSCGLPYNSFIQMNFGRFVHCPPPHTHTIHQHIYPTTQFSNPMNKMGNKILNKVRAQSGILLCLQCRRHIFLL